MDIPEILKNIAFYLDPPSLISACQVSIHWHTVITPLVWDTIHSQDWTHQAFRPRTLYKNAHLVRRLEWNAMTSSGAYMYQQAVAARAFENMVMGKNSGPYSQMEADVGRSSGSLSSSLPSSLLESEEDSMTPIDVREQWEESDPFVKHLQEQEQKEATADNKTRNGQVPTLTATEGTAFPHPILSTVALSSKTLPPSPRKSAKTTTAALVPPVLEHLSLTCLTKIVGQCTNLQRLCLHTTTISANEFGAGTCAGGMHLDMIPVLQSLVFLQDLELYVNRVVVYQDQDQEKMKSAGGVVKVDGGGIVVQDLVRRLNQLSRLSLRGSAFIFNTPSSSQEESASTAPTTAPTSSTDTINPLNDIFSLQNLTLDTPYISSSELTHLLTQCPRLKSLDLPGGLASWTWSPTASDTFLQTLRTCNKRLCEFSINASAHPAIPEDHLVALVRYGFTTLRPIRRFGARACQLPEGEIFLALLEQQEASLSRRQQQPENMDQDMDVDEEVKGLEELDISLAKRVSPLFRERLYEFLERAEGLRKVEAAGVWIALDDLLPSDNNTGEQPQQQQEHAGDDTGALPPAATTVNAGELTVDNLPTIAQAQAQALATTTTTTATTIPQTIPPLGPHCSRIASSKTLSNLHIGFTHPTRSTPHHLKAMYTLLSSLRNLHDLQLSYTCLTLPSSPSSSLTSLSSSPTTTSLSEHPFHALASLQHLRVFNIETCAYPVLTRLDIEWMLQNWPHLEKLVFNQLGASQERTINAWLKEFGREDLKVESSRPAGSMYF